MWLRNHPLMSFHGVTNWPPVWAWMEGVENKRPRGEIGILKKVSLTRLKPAKQCYLYIEHEGSLYIGCLLFDDEIFCSQILKLLQAHCNCPIADIGRLDLSHTF
jgi:hypothetical protein